MSALVYVFLDDSVFAVSYCHTF